MPGQIKALIDKIINERSKGDATLAKLTTVKLNLKGINPGQYTLTSPDEPAVIEKIKAIAKELGVNL